MDISKNGVELKSFTYTSGKKATYKKNNTTTYNMTYDNYGNLTKHLNNTLTWNSRNLLSKFGSVEYEYNHQGVRFKKKTNSGITKTYYLDGSRVLGEDWSDGKKIRYFYDAGGISGLRYDGYNFNFIRDGLGNVSKVMYRGKMIAEYIYDAFGNCSINYLGKNNDRDIFVTENNPFRWKCYYFDVETNCYYINSRYYSPELMMYLDAFSPENILSNAFILNALNRYNITIDNTVSLNPNSDSIFAATEFYPDPLYDPDKGKSWWDLNWKKAIQWILFVTILITSIALMCFPVTVFFGYGMFVAGMKCAIGGFIIGGLIVGIMNAVRGNSFIEGATEGAIYGAINGFSAGAIMYCVSQAASLIGASNCFIAGTLILTSAGYKKIEDIEVGDEVWSYNEDTDESCYKKVVRLFRNGKIFSPTQDNDIGEGVKDWINVRVTKENSNEELDLITCTFEHPFYVLNATPDRTTVLFEGKEENRAVGSWIASKYLRVGDKLLLSDGNYGIISSVEVEHYDDPQTTYNFEVADFHTYYVGKVGILVHNTCPGSLADDVANSADDAIQTGGTKDFSIHESRRAAYRSAKRDAGVLNQRPTSVTEAFNKQGKWIPGKHYNFGDKQILWHSAGHPEYGMTRHFNYNGWHYFY